MPVWLIVLLSVLGGLVGLYLLVIIVMAVYAARFIDKTAKHSDEFFNNFYRRRP